MFILLGRDPVASILVEDWVALRERLGVTAPEALAEARLCAEKMAQWAVKKGKAAQLASTNEARSKSGHDEHYVEQKQYERIRELEALCKRAADVLYQLRDNIDDLVKELRGA